MQQLTLEAGRPWEPPQPPPTDALAAGVLRVLADGAPHDRHDMAAMGWASERQIRAAVARLRALGWPIGLGSQSGYVLSWSADALDRLEATYRRQALAELRTLRLIRRARQRRGAA